MDPATPASPVSVMNENGNSSWSRPSDLLTGYGPGYSVVALPEHSVLTVVAVPRPSDGVQIGQSTFVVLETTILRSITVLRDFLLDIAVWHSRKDFLRLFELVIELQTGNLLGRFAIDMDQSGSDVPVVHHLCHLSSALLRVPVGPRRIRRMDVYHVLLSVALYPRSIDPSVN